MKIHPLVMAATMATGLLGLGGAASGDDASAAAAGRQAEERTSFQVFAPYAPRIHIGADVAIVYGIDKSVGERIKGWKDRGYRVHVMTGVAWGEYQDYLFGRWDGKNHEDEAQTTKSGERIGHGKDVYYMSPGESYGKYLCVGVKRAIDAGAEAIHLEEPEFWVRGGWEPNFKKEWKAYYNEDWLAPDSSPDAQWRASKLKYYLYRRALADVFSFVKDYSKEIGRDVKCYVPTHSLINYAHWGIVSPESALIDVGCDGYIAQVWTGTSRTPNVYDGEKAERTFETAFLEYGAMQNLVRASGRRVWYLNDPVEDNPNHSWVDYRRNWESTLVASLLQPEVWRYEVMPWPDRIFGWEYKKDDHSNEKVGMPADYEVELQAVIAAMNDMKQDDVAWQTCGTPGIGIVVSDTLMFQRFGPGMSDGDLSSFYGLALPLVKRGVPLEPVQLESVRAKQESGGFLSGYRVLMLTYEGQKAMTSDVHEGIAQWVKAGGALVVVDDDKDPYHKVREWWNTGKNSYATPREHLFEALGLARDFVGTQKVGKGVVLRAEESPARIAREKGGSERVRSWCREAGAAVGVKWEEAGALVLRRGRYVVAAGLDGETPVGGRFVDLFAKDLPVVSDVKLKAGDRRLLVDLSRVKGPTVAAASCRVLRQDVDGNRMTLRCDGIADTEAIVRAVLPAKPARVTVDGKAVEPRWTDGVATVRFDNDPAGRTVEIGW